MSGDDRSLVTGQRRLFYTREGDLDLSWLILSACCVVGLTMFVLDGFKVVKVSIEGWVWFGSFTLFAFISGVTIDRARLITAAKIGQHDPYQRPPEEN